MGKKYSCPFCNTYKGERPDLVEHIEETHEEYIIGKMTPNQIVFNVANNKGNATHGVCVVCKRDTDWDENSNKYGRLCGRKQCREALRKNAVDNHIKVYNKPTLLGDDEHQTKMLANRKISGKYRFEDGGYHTYTGSYEQKALEFIDKVLGFKSTDLLCPGPTLEYEYKGETHKWITDIFLIPFNLIIEVKDGGSNPNNRQMDSYREKQIAKESILSNMGTFNYLRLTDNDFSQLLYTIAELKASMIDDSEENKKVVININEEVEAIEEGINTKDFEYKVDDWINDKVKILFITGMTGSGKTTLGKKMAKKYNCDFIQLDDIYRKLSKEYTTKPKSEDIINRAILESNNRKCVIEGIHILFLDEFDIIKQNALIIKDINPIKSTINAINRDLFEKKIYNKMYGNELTVGTLKKKIDYIIHCILINYPKINYDIYKYKGIDKLKDILKESSFPDDIKFIKDKKNGINNAVVYIGDKQYRVRVEGLILDGNKVFAEKVDKETQYGNKYRLPGGSIEPGLSLEKSLELECNQEARLKIKNIKYSGKNYINDYNGKYPKWHVEKLHPIGLKYEGVVTYVFIAENDGKFTGHVDKHDADPSMCKNGKFYNANEIELSDIHRSALPNVIVENIVESVAKKCKTPNGFLKYLNSNKFQHGFMDRSGNKYFGKENPELYTIISPEDLITNRIGRCNDYMVLEHYIFNVMGLDNKMIAIVPKEHLRKQSVSGHGITLYKNNSKYYWFEYDITSIRGIHGPFSSYIDTIEYAKEKIAKSKNKDFSGNDFEFIEFDKAPSKYNIPYNDMVKDVIGSDIKWNYLYESINIQQENMGLAAIGAIPNPTSNVFITQYSHKTTSTTDEVEGYAISNDIVTDKIITITKKGKVTVKESSFLNGRKIRIFKYLGEVSNYETILISVNKMAYREYLYEALTGKKLLSDDQILCDESFQEISPTKIFAEYTSSAQSIIDQYKSLVGEEVIKIPLMNKESISEASSLIGSNKNIEIYENLNGFFAENGITKQRTGYYRNIKDIEIGVIL